MRRILRDPELATSEEEEDEEYDTMKCEMTHTIKSMNIKDKQRFIIDVEEEEEEEDSEA